jgi:hypothetical protein
MTVEHLRQISKDGFINRDLKFEIDRTKLDLPESVINPSIRGYFEGG